MSAGRCRTPEYLRARHGRGGRRICCSTSASGSPFPDRVDLVAGASSATAGRFPSTWRAGSSSTTISDDCTGARERRLSTADLWRRGEIASGRLRPVPQSFSPRASQGLRLYFLMRTQQQPEAARLHRPPPGSCVRADPERLLRRGTKSPHWRGLCESVKSPVRRHPLSPRRRNPDLSKFSVT